jgi:hypothetical protein
VVENYCDIDANALDVETNGDVCTYNLRALYQCVFHRSSLRKSHYGKKILAFVPFNLQYHELCSHRVCHVLLPMLNRRSNPLNVY